MIPRARSGPETEGKRIDPMDGASGAPPHGCPDAAAESVSRSRSDGIPMETRANVLVSGLSSDSLSEGPTPHVAGMLIPFRVGGARSGPTVIRFGHRVVPGAHEGDPS